VGWGIDSSAHVAFLRTKLGLSRDLPRGDSLVRKGDAAFVRGFINALASAAVAAVKVGVAIPILTMLENSMLHFGCRDDQVFVRSNGLTLKDDICSLTLGDAVAGNAASRCANEPADVYCDVFD